MTEAVFHEIHNEHGAYHAAVSVKVESQTVVSIVHHNTSHTMVPWLT